jgi:hypothetical protein
MTTTAETDGRRLAAVMEQLYAAERAGDETAIRTLSEELEDLIDRGRLHDLRNHPDPHSADPGLFLGRPDALVEYLKEIADMTTPTTTDHRLDGLTPGSALGDQAVAAFGRYDERIEGLPDCFDHWTLDPQDAAADAVAHLKLALDWFRAASELVDDLAEPNLTIGNDQLRETAEQAVASALCARGVVLVAWARHSLGTAGPTPRIESGSLETDGACCAVRGEALNSAVS